MECNKDEATRAKEIAEKKFAVKDITGARKFALKAYSLFPELEGIQKMVSTLDVYISAERKINGETDWYAVLGVDPSADDETVRKHYRKLALMLHPDKNKSVGAEGAFKLLSESWSMLSDKARRSAYDRKRRPRINPQRVPPSNEPNGFPNMNVDKTTNNSKGNSNHVSPSSHQKTTFWTVCQRCKMQYEYLRIYLNHNLLCPKCRQPFIATECSTSSPSNRSKVVYQNKHSHQHQSHHNHYGGQTSTSTVGGHSNIGNYSTNSRNQTNFQWVPFSGSGDGISPSSEAAASMVHNAYEQVKRERKEAQAAERKKTNSRLPNAKRRKGNEDHKGSSSGVRKGTSELSHLECQTMLMEKARKSINNKLELTHANISKSAETKRRKMNQKMDELKGKSQVLFKKDIIGNLPPREEMTMEVLDPDFYFFDKDRTEKCFKENQVWAMYSDDDFMPRLYAIITSVVSLNPFEVKLNWMKSKSKNEKNASNWAASGLSKACGEFIIGKFEVYNSLYSFSHKVSYAKGDEIITIFPRKGDIWALYKNWSPEWNDPTSDKIIQTYDIVEVLQDYDENIGVIIIPLVKVSGFKTVFHRTLDIDKESLIPKEEITRFSHQIPAHLLNTREAPRFLKGCWELDPAATPLQLQVILGKSEELNTKIDDEQDYQEENAIQNQKNRRIIILD